MVKFPDCYFGRNTSILAEFPGEEQSPSSHNPVFPGCLARWLNVWFGLPAFSARIIPIRASATPRCQERELLRCGEPACWLTVGLFWAQVF